MSSPNFVAIDVETAMGSRCSICQIGVVVVENGVITRSENYLVQPPNNQYSIHNTLVHGITPDQTEGKPYFPEVWSEILPILEGSLIVAHSADFDLNCIKQTLEHYGLNYTPFKAECTFKLTGQSLEEACFNNGITLDQHHNAEEDAIACAKLFLKVTDPNYISPIPTQEFKSKEKLNYEAAFTGHDKIKGDLLKPDLDHADPDSPFYSKKIVFTGVLNSISRLDAAEMVQKLGADIDTGISKRTDYVICGSAPGPSKMVKINKYNCEGANIKIINEVEFLKMIFKE